MRTYGSATAGGPTHVGHVPLPTTPRATGRDIVSDLAAAHTPTWRIPTTQQNPPQTTAPKTRTPRRRAPSTNPTRAGRGGQNRIDLDLQQLIDLHAAGHSHRAIATALGVSPPTIRDRLTRIDQLLADDRARRAATPTTNNTTNNRRSTAA